MPDCQTSSEEKRELARLYSFVRANRPHVWTRHGRLRSPWLDAAVLHLRTGSLAAMRKLASSITDEETS